MPKSENSPVKWDQQSTLLAAPHHVFADPKLEDLPRRHDPVLSLGQGADQSRRIPVLHQPHLLQRTASNFLAAGPET
jgi:hypothetical protein